MKWSWLFSLAVSWAAAMSPGIAGAQDIVPSTQPADVLILQAGKPLGDYPTTRPLLETPTQPTLSNSELEKLFDDLASTEPDVREVARTALLGLSRDELPALREVVRNAAPIAPAQAAALRDIVTHVFLAGEPYEGTNTGFMGVMLPPPPGLFQGQVQVQLPPPAPQPGVEDAAGADDGDAGITIQDCMPGFCGFRYLRPGDLIIGVQTTAAGVEGGVAAPGAAGVPGVPGAGGAPGVGADQQFMRTISDMTLITEVSRHLPGSPLTLRLIRQGRMIDVTVVLSDKPKALDMPHELHIVDEWREERRKMAQDYWQTVFEPLLGPHVS